MRLARFWWSVTAALWVLANAQLVMQAAEEAAALRARVAELAGRLDSYDRAWAALARARAGGRHLRSVHAGREAG